MKYQNFNNKKIRPVVGFLLATEFNECVAMDVKQWSYQDEVWLIHMVNHLTQYSASCVIQSKRKEVIRESILTPSWRGSLSYRNQSIDLQSKSMDWFLYYNGLCLERVKNKDSYIWIYLDIYPKVSCLIM